MKKLLKTALGLFMNLICLFSLSSLAGSQTVDVWSNLGLYGGQIHAVAIDPSNPDKVFVGSFMGDGLFVTTDGGNTWRSVHDAFGDRKTFDIEFAPSDPSIIWVASGDKVGKSIDGGINWTIIDNTDMQVGCIGCSGEIERFCQAVAIHPTDPDTVYIGAGGPGGTDTNGAIYKTEDGGDTWTKLSNIFDLNVNPIPNFNYSIFDIEIDPNSDNIWAATDGGNAWFASMYWSNDEGQTWIARTEMPIQWYDIALKPHATGTPSQMFIATAVGLYRATRDSDVNATPIEGVWVLGGVWGVENNIRAIAFDPQDPDTVYAAWKSPISWGGDGIGKVGRSTDSGDIWATYVPDLQFFALGVHPTNSSTIFGGHLNLGMYKSLNNGQVWTPINNGLTAVIVNDAMIDPNDSTHILIGTISGLYEKTGSGAWSKLLSYDTFSVQYHPTDSLTVYAGIEGYVAKTTDGGLNWTYTNIPDYWSYNFPSDIAIDPSNTDVVFIAVDYFGYGGAIHKSVDGGASFSLVLDGINQSAQDVPMNIVVIDPSNSQNIYAGSGEYAQTNILGDLWVSTASGATTTWNLTSLQNVIVNALLIDPNNSSIMYAGCGFSGGTSGGPPLYKSTNSGVTWIPSYAGIPDNQTWNAVTDLEFHPVNTDIIYASTTGSGVYISPNQAVNWVNLGTPATHVNAISTSSLYAATESGLLQCTGTGVITGALTDDATGNDIDGAVALSDLGGAGLSINGNYMFVASAGTCDVTVIAAGHANEVIKNVTVYGGDVTWLDIIMESGVPNTNLVPSSENLTEEAGGKVSCFIQASNNGKFIPIWMGWIFICVFLGISSLLFITLRKRVKHCSGRTILFSIGTILISSLIIFFSAGSINAGTLWGQVGIASSPNPVGSGARAIGMGGAFIGVADDATAASWNPAGLIQLEKPEFSIVADYNKRTEEFSSSVNPEVENKGEMDYVDLNYISVAYPFHFYKNIVVALNYQRLYDFNREFAYNVDYASAGLDLIQSKQYKQDGSVGALGLAGAIEIVPQVSFGLTANIWTDQLLWDNGWEESFTEHAVGTSSGVPVTIDTSINDSYSSFSGINANLGILWEITNRFTWGAVYKTPFTASIYHEFHYYQTQVYGNPINSTITSDYRMSENAKLHMPMSYGLGLAWRHSDILTFDLDIYRTHWSDYLFEDGDGNKFSPIDGRAEGDSNVADTTQVRLGGEYLIIKPDKNMVIPIRGGLFYDPEPTEGGVKEFYGLSIGSGVGYKRFIFDAAYQLRCGKDIDTGNLIATSEADIMQHTFILSLIYHFK